MFSPGVPLMPQPGVNKAGLPVQYQFPISYNTFPIDRSQGKPDIPSFQQLRTVAKLYSGITLCERAWFDMVPRMKLKISLHPDYVAQGYEEKDFQKEISFFRKWFEKPDGRRDIHTWLRMALREQTQIDELYIYKHRTRGGKLLGLHIVAGDTMKPLLNDWGDIPLPDDPEGGWAYQQYPWGIPGMYYTTDMMIHYQESPAAESPYGQSRVERIIMEVNQALRKKRRDLAMFTEGNIPQGIMEVPEGAGWTPDQIDAYEQSWNALMAGNPQQQVRMKFTMPGMKYIKLDNGEILTEFDLFLLNISTGSYGMSLQDLSFTEGIHKASGDSQQNVLYRRTIEPLAIVYGWLFTDCMNHDFDPSLHGEMFMVSFGGFEETEDLGALATAYSTLTNAGILGLTNAAKAMKLPEDPDAPHIGRVFMTANGPIFLDDMANDQVREAALKAKMAGFELAANPAPNEQPEEEQQGNEKTAQSAAKKDSSQTSDSGKEENGSRSSSGQKSGSVGSGSTQGPKGNQASSSHERAISTVSDHVAGNDSKENDPQQPHTGIMIAFMIDPETASQLALPGGEPIEDLHCTLAYLGDMYDEAQPGKLHPAETQETLKTVLAAFADSTTPLQGKVGGIGRFTPSESSGEMSPMIALVNTPGLQDWRRRLVETLQTANYHVANDFDYTPHITLSYLESDTHLPVDLIDALPLNFDTLCLAIGDDRYYFPIGGGTDEPRASKETESSQGDQGDNRGADSQSATRTTGNNAAQSGVSGPDLQATARADYRRWRTRAIEDIKMGRAPRSFTTTAIPEGIQRVISHALTRCTTADEVRRTFQRVQESEMPSAAMPSLAYNPNKDIWEPFDVEQQLETMRAEGTKYLRWLAGSSAAGVCVTCEPNEDVVRAIGEPFPSGHLLPQCHPNCQCGVERFTEKPEERK